MLRVIRGLLDEPKVPNPPARSRWEWLLVAALIVMTLIEGGFADAVDWRPVNLIAGTLAVFGLLWRRSHPLGAVAFSYGTFSAVALAAVIALDEWDPLASSAVVGVVLAYSLLRWASGRHAAIGLAIILVAGFLLEANLPDGSVLGAIVSSPFFLLPAGIGAAVRYRAHARQARLEEARLQERGELARELHDSVAHHVSAIAINAQAARAVAETKPEAGLEALGLIEEEATRTLAEMRKIVGALRSGSDAELAPQRGIADIASLGDTDSIGPELEVTMAGDLDGLGPTLDAGLYRLAQEAITNARRHARDASRIIVRVEGNDGVVQLTVTDDGDPVSPLRYEPGYGLTGSNERATLLGGTLEAGPGPQRGWIVKVLVPRSEIGS